MVSFVHNRYHQHFTDRLQLAGVKCNSTVATQGGICGGEGAQVNSLNQVDFAQDYCLSGEFPLVSSIEPI